MNPPATHSSRSALTCIEICAGAGGQAIGLERAGFEALAHVEYDCHACTTLRLNRPNWNVIEGDGPRGQLASSQRLRLQGNPDARSPYGKREP